MEREVAETEEQGNRRPPRGATGFVVIFIAVALGLLVAYHYAEDTALNRGYLNVTTQHTAVLLRLIGESAEVSTGTGWPSCGFTYKEGMYRRLTVAPECGAIEVMAIFFAAIVAFPTLWRKKIIGLALGFPLLYALNVFRVTCLFVIGALDQSDQYLDFAHHYVWQTVYIVFVVIVWLAWVRYVVERKRQDAPEDPTP